MKQTKKLLALTLSFLLLCSVSTVALAATPIEKGTAGTLNWVLDTDGVLSITGDGAMPDYDVYKGAPWTVYADRIASVTLGDGVTGIGTYAFYGCKKLAKVTFGKGLTRINARAFSGCSALSEAAFPETLSNIGNYAFEECYALTSVVLPTYLVNLGDGAFFRCVNLGGKLVMPKNLKSIPDNAFYGCASLEGVTLAEGTTRIGSSAFSDCSNLAEVTIPAGLVLLETNAFMNCYALESIVIPDGLTLIPAYAFAYSGLREISLPGSLRRVDTGAFANCPLEKVVFRGMLSQWKALIVGAENEALRLEPTIAPPAAEQPSTPSSSACAYCGETHGDGVWDRIIAFFHGLLAMFGLKKS